MLRLIFKSKITYVILILYVFLVLWWFKIYFSGVKSGSENYLFGLVYSFIALIGGINGLIISRKWGGFKSTLGRGISFLSLGLLAYCFGQVVWSYYNLILQVSVPYPSIADFGYFFAIVFYGLGMYFFAKTAGIKHNLQNVRGKIIVFIIPLIMLFGSWYFFLKDFQEDYSNYIKVFLDYGTPLGYAIAVSIGLIAYFLSRGVLGGKMSPRVLYIIVAFIAEYASDYTFLYQAAAGIYYNAGIDDLMFATTFMLMAVGLNLFRSSD